MHNVNAGYGGAATQTNLAMLFARIDADISNAQVMLENLLVAVPPNTTHLNPLHISPPDSPNESHNSLSCSIYPPSSRSSTDSKLSFDSTFYHQKPATMVENELTIASKIYAVLPRSRQDADAYCASLAPVSILVRHFNLFSPVTSPNDVDHIRRVECTDDDGTADNDSIMHGFQEGLEIFKTQTGSLVGKLRRRVDASSVISLSEVELSEF